MIPDNGGGVEETAGRQLRVRRRRDNRPGLDYRLELLRTFVYTPKYRLFMQNKDNLSTEAKQLTNNETTRQTENRQINKHHKKTVRQKNRGKHQIYKKEGDL